jgi:hypothetical protein
LSIGILPLTWQLSQLALRLPDPLLLRNGRRITTREAWWKFRRPQIVAAPLFVSSGSQQVEGGWVDAKGMFLGAVGAAPVYRLLGKKDLGRPSFLPWKLR